MLYYIVVTFKKGERKLPEFRDICLKMFKDDPRIRIVMEYGKNGDNPHLNIVCERQRLDNLRTSLTTKYKKTCEHYDAKRALLFKGFPPRDLGQVLGYLNKEDKHDILLDRGLEHVQMKNNKKTKAMSIGDRMLEDMPNCLHETCHHSGHCWNPETIMSWVYDWCVEHKVSAIPLVLKRLIQLALQEKLPSTGEEGVETKDTYKQKCLENIRRELFSM